MKAFAPQSQGLTSGTVPDTVMAGSLAKRPDRFIGSAAHNCQGGFRARAPNQREHLGTEPVHAVDVGVAVHGTEEYQVVPGSFGWSRGRIEVFDIRAERHDPDIIPAEPVPHDSPVVLREGDDPGGFTEGDCLQFADIPGVDRMMPAERGRFLHAGMALIDHRFDVMGEQHVRTIRRDGGGDEN